MYLNHVQLSNKSLQCSQFLSFNLQRIIVIQMGSSQHAKKLLAQFNIEKTFGNISILSKKANKKEKYIMKTYTANTKEQLIFKLRFFKEYRAKMEQNKQLTKLIEIIEEKDQHFCSTSHKLHLIFQYSDLNIGKQIKQRRQSMLRLHKKQSDIAKSKYFNYQDLCNILYSSLSALWFNKQLQNENPDFELKKFGTIFISNQNILIFQDGVLKIMDPFISNFHHRYNFNHKTYYSPQKLTDFGMNDDQKCAIFQLGMTLLQISLLQPMSQAYSGYAYMEEVTAKKLEKARQIYASQIQNSLVVSVFDLIQKMVQRERQDRFTLQQAIQYAQQMYEDHESLAQEISSSNPAKFYSNSGTKRKQLTKTDHSSKKKNTSYNKFYDFKNSTVCDRGQESINYLQNSPKITNFTIQQVQIQRQQNSSMLQSPQIVNLTKINEVSQSLIKAGIFSTVNIGDSYNYGTHYNHFKLNNTKPQQGVFTDPELMRTIYRQLKDIQDRKRLRVRDENLIGSKVIQRKDRFDCIQMTNSLKITNKAYLI